MSSPEKPVRCSDCGERIFFAKSKLTDEFIPLDARPVDPRIPGALALVGAVVFDRESLVDHLVTRGRINESPSDFGHYLAHRPRCKYAGDHRSEP